MPLFAVTFLAGVAIGLVLMAFLAIGTYDRGYRDAFFRRKEWRAELVARRQAVTAVSERAAQWANGAGQLTASRGVQPSAGAPMVTAFLDPPAAPAHLVASRARAAPAAAAPN